MTPEQRQAIAAVRDRARALFEGQQVEHRNCGTAMAEAFGLAPRSYQALSRGFITGSGLCGAVAAGQLVLGEYLGYGDSTAPISLQLKEASARFQREVVQRIDRRGSATLVCNDLVRNFHLFQEQERADFCAAIVASVAELVAEILIGAGASLLASPEAPTSA